MGSDHSAALSEIALAILCLASMASSLLTVRSMLKEMHETRKLLLDSLLVAQIRTMASRDPISNRAAIGALGNIMAPPTNGEAELNQKLASHAEMLHKAQAEARMSQMRKPARTPYVVEAGTMPFEDDEDETIDDTNANTIKE